MKTCLKKEFLLSVKPWMFLFSLLSVLVLIPNYPAIVGVGYCFLAIFLFFSNMRASRDLEFSAMLPVSRRDVVRSKAFVVVVLEMLQLLVAVPCALLANFLISPNGNPVGIDVNFAFFGLALLLFAVFNIIFLPWFFRTGYKAGIPAMVGILAALLLYGAFETLIALLPSWWSALDTLSPAGVPYRLALLAAGAAAYVLTLLLAVRLAERNFGRVDL